MKKKTLEDKKRDYKQNKKGNLDMSFHTKINPWNHIDGLSSNDF